MGITPLQLIEALRGTDPYMRTIFKEGGCYRFFLFLKQFWPDAIPATTQDFDHVATIINGTAYDIDGVVDWPYRGMDDGEIMQAEKWCFADQAFLSLGECPVCGEPLLVPPSQDDVALLEPQEEES